MVMKENLRIAVLFTLVTTLIFGVLYSLVVTGFAQIFFPAKANGELIVKDGRVIGSRLIGQPFSSDRYFHPRPSSAGSGYDPVASSGGASNLGPTNKALVERVNSDVQKLRAENPGVPIPIDLVTTSGSGLDPDISPAAAEFQIPRVARARGISEQELRALVGKHIEARQFGFLGEPRVNVLELNLALDSAFPAKK
jgi:potassium-transporting ATPase KdpC subunit